MLRSSRVLRFLLHILLPNPDVYIFLISIKYSWYKETVSFYLKKKKVGSKFDTASHVSRPVSDQLLPVWQACDLFPDGWRFLLCLFPTLPGLWRAVFLVHSNLLWNTKCAWSQHLDPDVAHNTLVDGGLEESFVLVFGLDPSFWHRAPKTDAVFLGIRAALVLTDRWGIGSMCAVQDP